MKYRARFSLSLFFVALLLPALACGFSDRLQEVEDTVSVASTAEAFVQQSDSIAQTVVAAAPEQGAAALATIQAGGGPEFDHLRDKVENLEPDENGNYTLMLTDDELNELLQVQQTITDPESQVQLENPIVTFTNGSVILNTQIVQPLEIDLSITMQPTVVDGQVQFELLSASLGPLNLPEGIVSAAQGTLDDAMSLAMVGVPADFSVHSIAVGEGTLTIIGRPA